MLNSVWSIVIALLIVLFLTMIILEPNLLDISYFSMLFYYMYKIK